MTFKMEEVLSPFNIGDLVEGDLIYAADSIEALKNAVVNGSTANIYKFKEYSTNIDCPFKSGQFGVTPYRYAYKVRAEEMTFKSNSWIKFV